MVRRIKKGKKRRKAGYAVKDRLCRLCGQRIKYSQDLNRHHISYEKDIVVSLHYQCHNLVHARVRYNNPYERRYGKDFGAVALAFDILRMYRPVTDMAIRHIEDVNKRIHWKDGRV